MSFHLLIAVAGLIALVSATRAREPGLTAKPVHVRANPAQPRTEGSVSARGQEVSGSFDLR